MTDYMPGRAKLLASELGPIDLRLAAPVAGAVPESPDPRLASILAERVREVIRQRDLRTPVVVLVDQRDAHRSARQAERGLQAAEASAEDDDVMSVVHRAPIIAREHRDASTRAQEPMCGS